MPIPPEVWRATVATGFAASLAAVGLKGMAREAVAISRNLRHVSALRRALSVRSKK